LPVEVKGQDHCGLEFQREDRIPGVPQNKK
jgi:hypothetical protein